MSPENTSLTRVAWDSVPLGYAAVQQFLLHHPPRGMAYDGSGVSLGVVGDVYYRARHPREPEAYNGPFLLGQWKDFGSRTVIRFGAVLASRRVRDPASFLPGDATSVDIEHIRDSYSGSDSTRVVSTVQLSSEANPDALRNVVAALDGLYGPPVSNTQSSCDFLMSNSYRLAFHAASGDVIYQWGGGGSGGGCAGIEVIRDGQPIGPGLDPGNLYADVTKILAHSGSGRQS
jgi:hypothetical protein